METLDSNSFFNYNWLHKFALHNYESYANADPFPHIVMERIIAQNLLLKVLESFPKPEADVHWGNLTAKFKSGNFSHAGKLHLLDEQQMSPILRNLIWEMNSSTFIRFLEKLTGIKGLIPDPRLLGGGLHQILPGGVLGVHADFTEHRYYKLSRRLNVLLYLNPHWNVEYEGHLELWTTDMTHCKRRIMPTLGRCVIFSTDKHSFHGHPQILKCPSGTTRKSIALYYYTNGRQDGALPTKSTDWRESPYNQLPKPE